MLHFVIKRIYHMYNILGRIHDDAEQPELRKEPSCIAIGASDRYGSVVAARCRDECPAGKADDKFHAEACSMIQYADIRGIEHDAFRQDDTLYGFHGKPDPLFTVSRRK